MSVRIRGFNELERFLLNLAPRTKRECQIATEASIREMQADAMQHAPVDTGKLRQSITFEITKGGLAASLSANVEYWAYVEFGTGGLVEVPEGFEELAGPYKGKGKRTINRAAQPFLIPAFLRHSEAYYKRIDDALGRIFR
ncbi:HK97-gp10 family putative phage morphogenesis protein [Spirosoma foliorum]|uniref:HK97 gp10 family phage protein n=1 Tax=Spirosoma foliorum TaxID=2710596 RepID=A0A7G5H2J0_9BACT|nr:HK97-gp10 family putative phage morphogenesis protein [Spirosoma foliorum]QMW05332.1 HK97 gp10 family phage protein [Spirosoma foliorum]